MSSLPKLETVPTPALVVDRMTLDDNLRRMADRARDAGVALWPHTKTHKTPQIARLQLDYGAEGVTAATVHEAQCFADAGAERILIAYPPVGSWRLEALLDLAETVDVRVVLDGLETVELLDDACRRAGRSLAYLWEVDCGVGRCGTNPGEPTADLVVAAQRRFGHAAFDGLMVFGGHAYIAPDDAGIRAAAEDERNALAQTVEALEARGVAVRARSAGTTPTSHRLERGPITEIRPGNYAFYDATQVTLGIATEDQCALAVLATVVARPDPRRLILDCGSKALAAERLSPRSTTFGFVRDHPELSVQRLFEEHAIVTSDEPIGIPIGARLQVVPNHSCATANLHSRILVAEGGEIVDVWAVTARGWDFRGAREHAQAARVAPLA
jgi:D-serine deaminase-like pyridoxal phosphate-dependent protein